MSESASAVLVATEPPRATASIPGQEASRSAIWSGSYSSMFVNLPAIGPDNPSNLLRLFRAADHDPAIHVYGGRGTTSSMPTAGTIGSTVSGGRTTRRVTAGTIFTSVRGPRLSLGWLSGTDPGELASHEDWTPQSLGPSGRISRPNSSQSPSGMRASETPRFRWDSGGGRQGDGSDSPPVDLAAGVRCSPDSRF
jgi:hypothetical protein